MGFAFLSACQSEDKGNGLFFADRIPEVQDRDPQSSNSVLDIYGQYDLLIVDRCLNESSDASGYPTTDGFAMEISRTEFKVTSALGACRTSYIYAIESITDSLIRFNELSLSQSGDCSGEFAFEEVEATPIDLEYPIAYDSENEIFLWGPSEDSASSCWLALKKRLSE